MALKVFRCSTVERLDGQCSALVPKDLNPASKVGQVCLGDFLYIIFPSFSKTNTTNSNFTETPKHFGKSFKFLLNFVGNKEAGGAHAHVCMLAK